MHETKLAHLPEGPRMAVVGVEIASAAEDAIRELLLARLSAAYRLATCILRDRDAAQDAVQEAALRAWTHRRELRDPGRVDAWFMRIVVNVCRAELERQARRPAAVEDEAVYEAAGAPVDSVGLRDEVGRAVARLSTDEQIVVALRFGRDLTVPQIAAQTGLREGTVKSRLHSAQDHLRAAFAAERRAEEAWR
jgi:RNA polymerase sigma-70 factor (ECF subfamily)